MDLPVAFYFNVNMNYTDLSFKEVSGLTSEMELETVIEGGVNNHVWQLPKHIRHPNLVMKRALSPVASEDVYWIHSVLEYGFFDPVITTDILVSLLNAEGNTIYSWFCTDAYPVKWETESLDSEKNSVLIESIEFTYTRIIRV